MQPELFGKCALITGSSAGIGFEIAKALAEAGCRVAINGRDAAHLGRAAAQLGRPDIVQITGDVSAPKEATRVATEATEKLGGLDILVCNVGSSASVPPGKESAEEWQRVFAVNLWSTTNMVESARAELEASKGVVVCISSICGVETIAGAPVTYSTAKAALNAYVRGISRPLGKSGVRINAIAPGNILFEGSVWERKVRENASAVQDMLVRDVPLGRLGTPEDVAQLAVYLASPRAGFATGQVWTLDGGQTRA